MTLDRRRIAALDLNADADIAWACVRRPGLIRRWYSWDTGDLDARIQDMFVTRARTRSDGRRRALYWDDGTTLELSPTGDAHRTHLSLERPSHGGLAHFDGVRDAVDETWLASVQTLAFALSVHPGKDRRSWLGLGLDAGPRSDRLLDRIGLHGVHGVPAGGHVSTVRPDGTTVGGTLAYRTDLQFGIRLHGFAESFLVVMELPSAVRPPNGQIDVVLNTFGMDEARFAETERRWGAWWGQRATPERAGAHG